MSALVFALAACAGGLGAAVRYLVDVGVAAALRRGRPSAAPAFGWGILVVNVTGSFVLGFVTALLPDAAFVFGAGFLGGYTTFSTAVLDSIGLWRDRARAASALHLVGTFGASVLAAILGLWIGLNL
ncbi:CrcB family protein [Microbacterium sp. CIAB417]|uniref:fluoride efflux transporter FluC n=1 Tax=Microbacterium sp. CIAB417 TaxID=2860287 RepID=UPI001FABCCEB|nr:CrcB family protein [Microbacterium sp. CIAB417]